MDKQSRRKNLLNGLCPYFTMFPLAFPYEILKENANSGEWVADPFCGRGTTNYASRLLGLPSIGIDSSPVAVAISQAKLANTNPSAILRAAKRILDKIHEPSEIPTGEFWQWAFHKDVLHKICRLREGLIQDCRSESRKALRAIMLGALHGPQPKTKNSYFSNQSPRTYAPKPDYAIRYWERHKLHPQKVNVLDIIEERAERYYEQEEPTAVGKILRGDSRRQKPYQFIEHSISWIITSPPYYGMNTYIPDQWLRMWFLGGEPSVNYSKDWQVTHSSPDDFASDLRSVWKNIGQFCVPGARLVIRFGGVNSRKVDSLQILLGSLEGSGWKVQQTNSAGFATSGYRQANHIHKSIKDPQEEYDVWAIWEN